MSKPGTLVGVGFILAASNSLAQAKETVAPLVEPVLSTANLLETAGGLVLVLLLIVGLAWLIRRFGRFPGLVQGDVQVLGAVSLGPREKAILLSVQGMRLLVGVAPGNIRTLYVLGQEAPQNQVDETAVTGFAKELERVKGPGRKS